MMENVYNEVRRGEIYCRKGKIDMIITKSVSRFSRNTVDCLKYTRELRALGIPVIFEKEGLNTMNSTSEIYISMYGIFAQSESESLSGNVRMGKAMSAKKGKVAFSYKNFLGYRRGADNQPEIDPEEAEIIRLIFNRYLSGDSLQAIKELLESKGYLSPTGKTTWSVATIRSILTNEKYKGDARLQKTYVIDCISHKAKRNDDRPQYYVENNHPPIVSREIFDRVQEEMARRASKRKVKEIGTKTESGKYSSKYALTDMLICGQCGTPYRRCTWSRAAELIQTITDAASGGEYTAEMQALAEELKTVKATIAEKKARQTTTQESESRIDEIMEALERLKHEPITLDNQALRKLIDCIRVMSKDEIRIIFRTYPKITKGVV